MTFPILRLLVTMITLSLMVLTGSAQISSKDNLKGKWYLFSRNRIVQLTITKDSLICQQLNWDLTNRNPGSKKEIQIINEQVSANGNIYLYVTKPQDTLKRISLSTIKIINPQKEIIIAINGTDSSFTDTSLIKQYISKDIDYKYGLPFFSESEIQRLKSQKSIEKMTKQDFGLYVNKVLRFRTELDSLSKLPNSPNGLLYYGYSMTRIIIGQLGYNPLVTNSEFEMFIRRFQNDPETKAICDQLFK